MAQKPTNLTHIEDLANKFGQIFQREIPEGWVNLLGLSINSLKNKSFAIDYLTSKQDLVNLGY